MGWIHTINGIIWFSCVPVRRVSLKQVQDCRGGTQNRGSNSACRTPFLQRTLWNCEGVPYSPQGMPMHSFRPQTLTDSSALEERWCIQEKVEFLLLLPVWWPVTRGIFQTRLLHPDRMKQARPPCGRSTEGGQSPRGQAPVTSLFNLFFCPDKVTLHGLTGPKDQEDKKNPKDSSRGEDRQIPRATFGWRDTESIFWFLGAKPVIGDQYLIDPDYCQKMTVVQFSDLPYCGQAQKRAFIKKFLQEAKSALLAEGGFRNPLLCIAIYGLW